MFLVELIEYSLVFLVSSALAGGSVVALAGFNSAARSLEDRAALSSLHLLAARAVEQGAASAKLTTWDADVQCHDGSLTLATSSFNGSATLPVGCDFEFRDLSGVHVFTFASDEGQLSLKVG